MSVSAAWKRHPHSNLYNQGSNWVGGTASFSTATFGATDISHIRFSSAGNLGGWVFKQGAPHYVFTIASDQELDFLGDGISGGKVEIVNHHIVAFKNDSTADRATILTTSGAQTVFSNHADGGNARLITRPGGTVDISGSSGTYGDHIVGAGSIEGGGVYFLGNNLFVVGGNNRSTKVSGEIADGGSVPNAGATLTKVGHGTLKLAHSNSFSGGLLLNGGAVDLVADGSWGTGAIEFINAHNSTLKVENAAFDGNLFSTQISDFDVGDKLILPGLKFHKHATATYDSAATALVVHSGGHSRVFNDFVDATDGTYKAVNDGHGGTKVIVVAPHEKPNADSFAFKSAAELGNKEPAHDQPALGGDARHALDHDYSSAWLAADHVHHHQADADFLHRGDLFA